MFKTEEELRNHFGTHKLADWAAKAVQAWILEFQEKARERC
jgi:hypothetical protein